MRVTWLWALGPDDDESPNPVPQARSSARRTPRPRIEPTTHRTAPTEGNTRYV